MDRHYKNRKHATLETSMFILKLLGECCISEVIDGEKYARYKPGFDDAYVHRKAREVQASCPITAIKRIRMRNYGVMLNTKPKPKPAPAPAQQELPFDPHKIMNDHRMLTEMKLMMARIVPISNAQRDLFQMVVHLYNRLGEELPPCTYPEE